MKIVGQFSKILGWQTNRKILLFISDDWGGVRIRSTEDRQSMIRKGILINDNRFDRYDGLESNKDLEDLFEVLLSYRDQSGNNPVITPACNVANPDFKRIKHNGFRDYYYEPFTETLRRYPLSDRVYNLYKKGIELNIFKPEFHGREHLNVNWWLENFQADNKMIRSAFDHEFWHLPAKHLSNPLHRGLVASYDIKTLEEVKSQTETVNDGARLFKELFGYSSKLFIPPAQHFHKNLEKGIAEAGFKMIDVPRLRKMPLGHGKFRTKLHYLGQRSNVGLRYLTRNVVFEPNLNEKFTGVNECLADIEQAFRFKKPAIISNHRAAFTGRLESRNREKGLYALTQLLSSVLKRWPDIEFMSASSFSDILNS